MAAFTATYTVTEASHWTAGSYFRFDYFRDEFGQTLAYLTGSHAHAGNPGDGATIAAANPLAIDFYALIGGPFA